MFSHDKLKVYQKALASVARLAKQLVLWDKRHSVVDHLLRASESIVLNIAEGARLRSGGNKQHLLDYAMGSALECAACLDIAVVKRFLLPDRATGEKQCLCEVVRMLMGLRSSWGDGALREEPAEYQTPHESGKNVRLFPHETLDVYQVGLECMRWFHALPAGAELSSRLYRQVDKAVTSAILNVAEGNGRFPGGDRRTFLDIAQASAVKAAAYLDLCEGNAELEPAHRQRGAVLLGRIALMTGVMARS